ncbi:paraquat-inducible protein A [Neisseriaceae bacterium TC5R-5]|nr:paraquat-inducible protein A [Neisseriaceae bacterium TC5R-5]
MATLTARTGKLTACHDCDLLLALPDGVDGELCCPCCGAHVHHQGEQRAELPLALSLAGVMVFVLANLFPVLTLEVAGIRSTATLWQTALSLEQQGMLFVALLVLMTGIIMPALELGSILYVRLPLFFGWMPPGFPAIIRFKAMVRPWCMVEVFLMGILVSLVKLVGLATVHPGVGLWALFALIILMAANACVFKPEDLWECYQRCRPIE